MRLTEGRIKQASSSVAATQQAFAESPLEPKPSFEELPEMDGKVPCLSKYSHDTLETGGGDGFGNAYKVGFELGARLARVGHLLNLREEETK